MRTALAIATVLLLTGCTTLREAAQVAMALSRPPSDAQVQAQTKSLEASSSAATAKLQAIQDSGRTPTDAEMHAIINDMVSGKAPSVPKSAGEQIPDDQDIRIILEFKGAHPGGKNGKQLDFTFTATWGLKKSVTKDLSFAASTGKGEASLDLGVARVKVVPKIVSSSKGRYDIELTDSVGALLGRFALLDSGKQVEVAQRPSKYEANLAYYDPESRLTGYSFRRPDSRSPLLGLVFMGKGYSFVESGKKVDLSKGYRFPEMSVVVLPKGWFVDHEIKDTRKIFKRGTEVYGGI